MLNGTAAPVQKTRERSIAGNLNRPPGCSSISMGSRTRGNTSRSCSTHCRRRNTVTDIETTNNAARNEHHQNNGTIQMCQGISCPGGIPMNAHRNS